MTDTLPRSPGDAATHFGDVDRFPAIVEASVGVYRRSMLPRHGDVRGMHRLRRRGRSDGPVRQV